MIFAKYKGKLVDSGKHIPSALMFTDRTLWAMVALMALGAIGRALVTHERWDWRRLMGEITLAALGAVVLWAFGLLNHLSGAQTIFLGGSASLGGVRALQWLVQAWKRLKEPM